MQDPSQKVAQEASQHAPPQPQPAASSTAADPPPVLEVRGLTKRFPGVLANDHIDLTLRKGQVLGLLGENGAGKSTLMNLIYGLYAPDEGEIFVNGQKANIHNPNDAIALGIGMVHQHFQLVPVLTVTENIMLGNESLRAFGFLNRRAARQRILEISEQYGLEVDPDAKVQDLSVGIQQRVEIIKALYRKADILILDEPTAVLTPQETRGLFGIMQTLKKRGVSMIFISHKLKEVIEICDAITVLRGGRVAGSADPRSATQELLATTMVGRDVILQVDKSPSRAGAPVLTIDSLNVLDDRGLPAVRDLTLEVRTGEILGVAGVQGNGQTELVEAITGLREALSGKVLLDGQDITNARPRRITEAGVGHVPEDRSKNGMVKPFAIKDNTRLQQYYLGPFAIGIVANDPAINDHAQHLVNQYDVRTPGIFVSIGSLSGGNQQKVIVAREFSRQNKLLIAAQPTRGLDVGSIEFIHKQIVRMRDEGTGVLLVSTELDEILALSDRIAVMYAGQVIDILPIEEATRENIGLLMAGVKSPQRLHEVPAVEVEGER